MYGLQSVWQEDINFHLLHCSNSWKSGWKEGVNRQENMDLLLLQSNTHQTSSTSGRRDCMHDTRIITRCTTKIHFSFLFFFFSSQQKTVMHALLHLNGVHLLLLTDSMKKNFVKNKKENGRKKKWHPVPDFWIDDVNNTWIHMRTHFSVIIDWSCFHATAHELHTHNTQRRAVCQRVMSSQWQTHQEDSSNKTWRCEHLVREEREKFTLFASRFVWE